MHKVESNTFLNEVLTDAFLIMQQESVFYSRHRIDVDK
jgi:hypothetical protein